MTLANENNKAVIELRNVSLKFDREIFSDVNIRINKGDSVVFVGPSGQGKSSLLKLIANLLFPTSGEVFWGGRNVKDLSKIEHVGWLRKIGMLFQQNALFDSMTVFDNVAFPLLEVTKLSRAEVKKRVEIYLNAVHLLEASQLYPNQISGGMQKRLGIARALALEPSVVLYDDPTAGLDPITSRRIVQLIQELKVKENSTTVTVTNDMNRAYQLAGRIIFVMGGKLIETGSKEETLGYRDPRIQNFVHGGIA